mmetsp:Transcript_54070/g.139667  ORF Transcript_54070/g.139667 Transcript_54070/m.139667 type:complete len:93 (-) Transcript_54070:688-966(-)
MQFATKSVIAGDPKEKEIDAAGCATYCNAQPKARQVPDTKVWFEWYGSIGGITCNCFNVPSSSQFPPSKCEPSGYEWFGTVSEDCGAPSQEC